MLFVVVHERVVGDEPIRCVDEANGPFEGKDIADAEQKVFEHFRSSDKAPVGTPIGWLVRNGLRVIPLEGDFNDQMPKAT